MRAPRAAWSGEGQLAVSCSCHELLSSTSETRLAQTLLYPREPPASLPLLQLQLFAQCFCRKQSPKLFRRVLHVAAVFCQDPWRCPQWPFQRSSAMPLHCCLGRPVTLSPSPLPVPLLLWGKTLPGGVQGALCLPPPCVTPSPPAPWEAGLVSLAPGPPISYPLVFRMLGFLSFFISPPSRCFCQCVISWHSTEASIPGVLSR